MVVRFKPKLQHTCCYVKFVIGADVYQMMNSKQVLQQTYFIMQSIHNKSILLFSHKF